MRSDPASLDVLPWERNSGDPSGVGICLSGGGIRAAAFALGAVQALQSERGLLFGPKAADYLAVVSGGSYTGGLLTLNSAALGSTQASESPPPLAEGTPEAEHVLANGMYLVHGGAFRTAAKFVLFGSLNFLAFVAIFVWAGALLADYAVLLAHGTSRSWLGIHHVGPAPGRLVWPAGLGTLVGGAVLLRGIYKDGGLQRILLPLLGLGLLLASAPSFVAAAERVGPLSEVSWWANWWHPLAAIGAVALVALAWWASGHVGPRSIRPDAAHAVARFAVMVPRVTGLVLLSQITVWWTMRLGPAFDERASQSDVQSTGLSFVAVLFGALLFGAIVSRVSLHRLYRDQLAWCFAVRRNGDGVETLPPTEVRLSSMTPPRSGSACAFPRLLVAATANVINRGPDRRLRGFAPFVFSHDRSGIPGQPGASFCTTVLENLRVPAKPQIRGTEPLLSLMSAVASTGAAVSPSMGARTIPALRSFIAVANLRLGRWYPNPLSPRIRRAVEASGRFRKVGLGSGYDEFVPEIFGLHLSDEPRIYVSDGGHYDNLGLLALLRARCARVWCVDSQADAGGRAGQLRSVVKLAQTELGITISVETAAFATTNGLMGTTHAIGEIDYGRGHKGTLIVVKLGLTASSPRALRDRPMHDRAFPHHSTFRYPAFHRDRMEAYVWLGRCNAKLALADPSTQERALAT